MDARYIGQDFVVSSPPNPSRRRPRSAAWKERRRPEHLASEGQRVSHAKRLGQTELFLLASCYY